MKIWKMAAVAATALAALPASAATFVVDAQNNSSSGGTALSTIALTAGQVFKVSSSLNDLWSAGALPRFSDANGLIADRFATAADDSGQPVGTQIGTNFGAYSQFGHTSVFGKLVGRINGVYQDVGANFQGAAWQTGNLELFYWDSNNDDNTGQISFNISAIPEPASWAFMIAGFGIVGAAARRRQTGKVVTA